MQIGFLKFRLVQPGEALQAFDDFQDAFAGGIAYPVVILQRFQGADKLLVLLQRLQRRRPLQGGGNRRNAAAGNVGGAFDRSDRGVDLVGDPRHQRSQRGHFLRLDQLPLGGL